MPGICGGLSTADRHRAVFFLPGMLQRMRRHDWHREEFCSDLEVGLALGRVSLGFVNTAKQPAAAQGNRFLAVMDGELYDADAARSWLLARGIRPAGQSHAELVALGLESGGREFLRSLHGSYSMVIWDSRERRLHLVNDRFGTRPLYYHKCAGELLFASNIAAILSDPEVSREINAAGLAQFFTFGHYLRDDTSLTAVRVLPGAGWMTWDVDEDRLTVDQYWSVTEPAADASTKVELLERIDVAFKEAVDRRTVAAAGLGLSLSGGLDARSVLGVIDPEQSPLQTVCLGMAGSLDHRSAAQLAKLAGCPHHNHQLGAGFLDSFGRHLEEMVQLTDGQYLSQCIVMPTLALYRRLGVQVLLRGHAGELMHMTKAYNYSLDAGGQSIQSDKHLRDWLWRRLQAYMLGGVEKPVFARRYQQEMTSLAQQSLDCDLEETRGEGPPLQQIWRLFVAQRLRRETVLSLVKFRSVVETRLPFLDNQLVDLLLAAPPSLKLGEEIQTHILRKRRPEFLKVLNANTGAPMGAGPFATRIAQLRMKVLAKIGAPGYQPYERLGLWLRRDLAPLVRETLLSEQCLGRGVFDPAGVRAVVEQHLNRVRNHTFLLLAMMIFEHGQRRMCGESCDAQVSENGEPRSLSSAARP
jgi:asparagine synthase (glutamine-hydrolysing)